MAPEEQAEVELDDDALAIAAGGATSVTLNVSFVPADQKEVMVGQTNSTTVVSADTFLPFDSSF